MSKSNHFSTKYVFGQMISLIDEGLVNREVKNVIPTAIPNALRQEII